MGTHYEWVLETVELVEDAENGQYEGDIVDIEHFRTYALLAESVRFWPAEEGEVYRVALVKTVSGRRGWAYVEDGKLSPRFESAMGGDMGPVPGAYVKQFTDAS